VVETVGVGQDEVDVVRAADVVCVVLVPGMGDDIQAIKAGILEIADLFVINKADRPGADRLIADLDAMLSLVPSARPRPAMLKTVAVRDEGVAALRQAIEEFVGGADPARRGERRRQRAGARFRALLAERLLHVALERAFPPGTLEAVVTDIAERRSDPYSSVEAVLERVLAQDPGPEGGRA
jgi:LAO/AO transport system kinase